MYVTEAQLAASDGSSLVGFVQSGTGAAARTVEDELRDTLKPQQFGTRGDGISSPSATEHEGFNAALAAARNSDDAYFSAAVLAPSAIYRLTDPVDLPPTFVRLAGDDGAILFGATGKHVLRADGTSFLLSNIEGLKTYKGKDALHVGSDGEIASLRLTDVAFGAFAGSGMYFKAGVTSCQFTRIDIDGELATAATASGHALHSNGGINNNCALIDSNLTYCPNDVVRLESQANGWDFRNVRIEAGGREGKSQYYLESPTGVGIIGGWSERSHEYLLTTVGGEEDQAGVVIDRLVSIGSQWEGSGGLVPSKFDVGSRLITFGSNIWYSQTTAPDNCFIYGVNKNLVGNPNVWTEKHAWGGRLRSRHVNEEDASSFDLLVFTRGGTSPNDYSNLQEVTGLLNITFVGGNAVGVPRYITRTYKVAAFGLGNNLSLLVSKVAGAEIEIASVDGAGSITMTVQAKSGATATAATLECVMTNVGAFQSIVKWSFDYQSTTNRLENALQVTVG